MLLIRFICARRLCKISYIIIYFVADVFLAYAALLFACYSVGLVRRNLYSGCPTKQFSNQSPQLQRLARKMKFFMEQACLQCSPDSE